MGDVGAGRLPPPASVSSETWVPGRVLCFFRLKRPHLWRPGSVAPLPALEGPPQLRQGASAHSQDLVDRGLEFDLPVATFVPRSPSPRCSTTRSNTRSVAFVILASQLSILGSELCFLDGGVVTAGLASCQATPDAVSIVVRGLSSSVSRGGPNTSKDIPNCEIHLQHCG